MRRVRNSDGSHVILDATPRRVPARGRWAVTMRTPRQIAGDTDVRKLLDLIRKRLGDVLRASAGPALASKWSMLPIVGSVSRARTGLEDDARTSDRYLAQVYDRQAAATIPKVVAEWLRQAVPDSGDGVGTESTPNTGGGQIPR